MFAAKLYFCRITAIHLGLCWFTNISRYGEGRYVDYCVEVFFRKCWWETFSWCANIFTTTAQRRAAQKLQREKWIQRIHQKWFASNLFAFSFGLFLWNCCLLCEILKSSKPVCRQSLCQMTFTGILRNYEGVPEDEENFDEAIKNVNSALVPAKVKLFPSDQSGNFSFSTFSRWGEPICSSRLLILCSAFFLDSFRGTRHSEWHLLPRPGLRGRQNETRQVLVLCGKEKRLFALTTVILPVLYFSVTSVLADGKSCERIRWKRRTRLDGKFIQDSDYERNYHVITFWWYKRKFLVCRISASQRKYSWHDCRFRAIHPVAECVQRTSCSGYSCRDATFTQHSSNARKGKYLFWTDFGLGPKIVMEWRIVVVNNCILLSVIMWVVLKLWACGSAESARTNKI